MRNLINDPQNSNTERTLRHSMWSILKCFCRYNLNVYFGHKPNWILSWSYWLNTIWLNLACKPNSHMQVSTYTQQVKSVRDSDSSTKSRFSVKPRCKHSFIGFIPSVLLHYTLPGTWYPSIWLNPLPYQWPHTESQFNAPPSQSALTIIKCTNFSSWRTAWT